MSTAEASSDLSLIGWPLTRPVYDVRIRCYEATCIFQASKTRRLRRRIRKAKKRLKRQRNNFAAVKISHVDALDGGVLITIELLVISRKFDYNAQLIGTVIEEAFAR